jgi:AcrR family transcriptional regulator
MTHTADRPQPQGKRIDGRRLRTEESRRRVVAALLDRVREGDVNPSAEAVAQRAGVGLRTVFRLFKDKEGLFRQMSEAVTAGFAETAATPFAGATWREQLEELMERRFAVFEQVMPYRRAAQAHAHYSETVRRNNETMRQFLRKTLVSVTPAALREDKAAFEALDLALSIDAWIRLRLEQHLDPARARATVRRVVSALTEALA